MLGVGQEHKGGGGQRGMGRSAVGEGKNLVFAQLLFMSFTHFPNGFLVFFLLIETLYIGWSLALCHRIQILPQFVFFFEQYL